LPDGTVRRVFFYGNADGNDYLNNFYNSLELTGKFSTGIIKHSLLLGGDYLRSDQRYTLGFDRSIPNSNINTQFHQAQAPAITDYEAYHFSLPWFGLYAQDQIELPYHLHLLAGLRYDQADNTNDYRYSVNDQTTHNPTVTDDKVSPRGGIVWQPIPEASVYGSYTENFGTSNGISTDGKSLAPQTAQQWEVGTKTELFDGKLTSTLAYFDLKKQHLPMQLSDGYTRAVGEVETRGIELDISGEILPGWKIIGGYAYTPFAKTINDTDGNGTIGKRLHNVPENNGSLWSTYEFHSADFRGLKLGAGVQAVGRRYIGYTEESKAPGYATLNLMASQIWKIGNTNVTAQLNADNLLDKTYFGGLYSYGTAVYGAPRTFMGSVKIEY
jgi:iron complex outermembrane receptor protein